MKRTQNACRPCRQSKIKCTGDSPCSSCKRRLVKCVYDFENVRVAISRRYLHNLQQQVRDLQRSAGPQETQASPGPPASVSTEEISPAQEWNNTMQMQTYNVWTSPFDVPTSIIKNSEHDRFRWIWLAPSSIFSFYDRLALLMTDRLSLEPPISREEMVYPLRWATVLPESPIDISDLPSIDHALFLFNTVKFNFSQVYRLFEEDVFTAHLKEFYYGDGRQKATRDRLWFVQFLLILAFGKAFTEHRTLSTDPGAGYFSRAMSLLPEYTSLWRSGVAASEVLALAALFMYCIDHLKSAHVYLGQAIRIAMMEGLHTELPEEQLGKNTVDQCRNLWWTLYILDRRFSSGLGIPVIVHDDDITTPLTPLNTASPEDATLYLLVKLWQLMSRILSTIYKTHKIQLGSFLEMTSSILKSLADNAHEIEQTIEFRFHNSVGRLPKGTRRVTLTYHQCVIFATRPLLLSVLKERLDKPGQTEEDWQNFLALTATLISTGIKSALSMIQILSQEGDLLETFFLNDLEFVYGASLFLTMATALFPHESGSYRYRPKAHEILDEIIRKGNNVAAVRKRELVYMEYLFDQFTEKTNRAGESTFNLFDPGTSAVPRAGETTEGQPGHSSTVGLPTDLVTPESTEFQEQVASGNFTSPAGFDLMDEMGISSYDFYSLVDEIGMQPPI